MTPTDLSFHKEGYVKKQEDVYEILKPLADGIWYIKTKDNGRQYKLLVNKLEDLPEAMKLAELEPYRIPIAKALQELFETTEQKIWDEEVVISRLLSILSLKEMVDTIYKAIFKEQGM